MLQLTQQPQAPPYYSPSAGPQGDIVWAFYDDALIFIQATFAKIVITIPSGGASGTITLDGQVFTATAGGAATDAEFPAVANALLTAANLADAVRANQLTAGRWQFDITGTSSSAVLTMTASIAGQVSGTVAETLTPAYNPVLTQGTPGELQGRISLVYQGFARFNDGKEVALTPSQTVSPGYDYVKGLLTTFKVSLQDAVRAFLRTPFPGRFANSPRYNFEPLAVVYLRYGSLQYSGCELVGQDVRLSKTVYVVNQSLGQFEERGPQSFAPLSSGSASKRLLSLAPELGMPMYSDQFAWVYAFYNQWDAAINNPRDAAFRYRYYDTAGTQLGVSSIQSLPWSTANKIGAAVLSVPCGPGNLAGTYPVVPPTGTTQIQVEVGYVSAGGGVFTQLYEPYRYTVLPGDCVGPELYFLGPYGGWESLVFSEELEQATTLTQTRHTFASSARVWKTFGLASYQDYMAWLEQAGDSQRATVAHRRIKVRVRLDHTENARRMFEALLTSEDRRLAVRKSIYINEQYVVAVRIVSLTSEAILKPESGRPEYDLTFELAERLEQIPVA